MKSKHSILNNTKLMMNIFSFLEISDLIRIRSLNSSSRLISDYYVKININRDKAKFKTNSKTQLQNSDYLPENDRHSGNVSNENHCFPTAPSSSSLLRLKFLQLWNIYSNNNYIEKINYYDNKLCLLVKILLYLILNVKQEVNWNLNLNPEISQEDLFTFLEHSSNPNHACRSSEDNPVYIQEFLRNETIWKSLAILSGYNLSYAELISDQDGIGAVDYYLWPEKICEPKQCIINQNIIRIIALNLQNIKDLNPFVYKQASLLQFNSSSRAELTFYNNNGQIVNRSNIQISNRNQSCSKSSIHDLDFFEINPPKTGLNQQFLQPSHLPNNINEQISSILATWIVSYLKLQKQLPCLKKVPKTRRSHQSFHNHHYLSESKTANGNPISRNKHPTLNKGFDPNSSINDFKDSGVSASSYSCDSKLPETFGKLCNVIKSQENLLNELKFILNTIK
ncbi:hypothetical protein HWI79_817 [Cryptosporidium felis]|nr:hypothetical protein HWI79_817 [Cryptosporidium felis]